MTHAEPLALGGPIPFETGADWDAATHLDGIPIRPNVGVEDRVLMREVRHVAEVCQDVRGPTEN
jgi:hypothetical protein